ncbi:MAG TPA: glycosyltransferase family 39 protein [Terriglobales bacterium]|jgi:hypothetical protein
MAVSASSPRLGESVFPKRSLLIFLATFLCRMVVGYHFFAIGGMSRQWTNETAAIAHSLVVHHSYAAVYSGYSGPTAWLAPVYPFLVAACFRILGIDSPAAAGALLLLNSIFSCLTAVLIYRLGREYFSESAGLVAAVAWALSPLAAMNTLLLWDTALSALMVCLSLLAVLRANSTPSWAGAGALWGLSALVSPVLLAPLPAILAVRLWRNPSRVKYAATCCLVAACVLMPWSIRNRVVLGATFPVRSNAWAEIYFGNVSFDLHPCARPNGLYQQVGETRFVQQMRLGAIDYVGAHPGEFAWMSLQRWIKFWLVPIGLLPLTAGIALGVLAGGVLLARDRGWAAAPFLAVPIFYPVLYSMTHIEARYRHPIEPVLYLLAAYAIVSLARRLRLGPRLGR